MGVILSLIALLLFNILGFALPALLAAWLFTLFLPVTFSQVLWLSLGTLIVVGYILQNITDMPGGTSFGLVERLVGVFITYILLALSGLAGRLLLLIWSVELTIFEAVLLFTVSLIAGVFFLFRSGTVGLPRWMTLSDFDVDDETVYEFDDDAYVISPPKRRPKRKSKPRRRVAN